MPIRGPQTVNEWVDVINKLVIALAGVTVAAASAWIALSAYHLNQDVYRQNLRKELHGYLLQFMPDTADTLAGVRRANNLQRACVDYRSRMRPADALMFEGPCASIPVVSTGKAAAVGADATDALDDAPSAYTDSAQAQAFNDVLINQEQADLTPPGPHWFAVIGTVPGENEAGARRLSAELSRRLLDAGLDAGVRLYRTRASRSYALTYGGPVAEAEARDLVRGIRSAGVVADAFPQADRSWFAIPE